MPQVLSSLALDDSQFVQRCAVVAASGEAVTITFRAQRTETLEPQYRGLRLVKRWVLASVTGEPQYLPDVASGQRPSPCLSPEAVVQAQLDALRHGPSLKN